MRRSRPVFTLGFLAGLLFATILLLPGSGRRVQALTAYEDLSLFSSVLRIIRENYVEEVDESELIRGAVRGMLVELDPHSSYLDPEMHREMQIDTRGEFHGLGIEIHKRRDGVIEVVSPIHGTPAWRAGIKAQDHIVAICPTEAPEDWEEPCRSTKTLDLQEAVGLMRGPKGSSITIEIWREGFDQPQPYEIRRDVVKVASVEGRILEDAHAYVRVRTFQERTARDLSETLDRLREDVGSFRGLVVDLRDNPGGLLDQAVRVADIWIDDGVIVSTKGRDAVVQEEFRAEPSADGEYPIVVLVNAGSASASEIVAGALQDRGRALVVGVPTFGKGSVQTVYPLSDGGRSALRLTTALYYTPAGRSIQEVGIAPDIEVQEAPLAEEDEEPRRLREKDLERHFTQEKADPAAEDEARSGPAGEDVQLARALEVLKSWVYFERLRDARDGKVLSAGADAASDTATP